MITHLMTGFSRKYSPLKAGSRAKQCLQAFVWELQKCSQAEQLLFRYVFFEPDSAAVAAEIGIRASLCNSVLALGDDYDFEQDRAVIETRALIRDWHLAANGRIRADVGIHAEYTSLPEHWRKVSELAEKHNLVTQIHLSETKRETDECIARYGKTPTEILNENGVFNTRTLAAHGVYLTNRDMSILARRGVSVAHNPVSNLKLASGIANVTAMLKSGINVSLGTDGCASNNSHDLFEELKLAALLAKGTSLDPTAVPAYSALKLATVNGAYAQGRENEIGRLIPGFDADIIMVNTHSPRLRPVYDPCGTVVYSACGSDVCLTVVQGKFCMKTDGGSPLMFQKQLRMPNVSVFLRYSASEAQLNKQQGSMPASH